jgi:hypothetical protein
MTRCIKSPDGYAPVGLERAHRSERQNSPG